MQKILDQQCQGFLLTCDRNKQKQAIKDAYNFISEYVERIYEDLQEQVIRKMIKSQGKQLNLQNELKEAKKGQNRMLYSVETNVQCLIFIKINKKFKQIDPNKVVQVLMKDMHENNRQLTRYCHRILPVEMAFRAQHFKMINSIEELFQKRDNSEIKSWSLNFKCRNNSKFNFKQVLKAVQTIAAKYGHFAELYFPQWTISVQITNHLMCLSISENFKQFQEFKLRRKPFQFTPQEREQYQANMALKFGNKRQKMKNKQVEQVIDQNKEEIEKIQEKIEIKQSNISLLGQEIKLKQDDVDLI